jgi:mono/diheme cytochrome c family protein
MFSRSRIALMLALLLSLIFVIPVFAGGWAIISLDELPTGVVAGEPLTIGFSVLQHGQTPMTGLTPTITVTLPKDDYFVVNAEPEGKPGHYTAILNFPKEGDWNWSIQAFTMDQSMPTLSVAAPAVKTASPPVVNNVSVTASNSILPIIRITALGIGLAGLAFAFRRKSRPAVVLTVFCLSVGIGSFVMVPAVPAVEAQSQSSPEVASESSVSPVEMGRNLFIAKGCITCHANGKIGEYGAIDVGAPNLTNFSASPEALRLRLKDPSAVKSDTWMPDLNLSDIEIEALIAFINSK